MIIYTVMIAAEGITFGVAGTALLHSRKSRHTFFDVPSRNTSLT
jgi:hypothetical protein